MSWRFPQFQLIMQLTFQGLGFMEFRMHIQEVIIQFQLNVLSLNNHTGVIADSCHEYILSAKRTAPVFNQKNNRLIYWALIYLRSSGSQPIDPCVNQGSNKSCAYCSSRTHSDRLNSNSFTCLLFRKNSLTHKCKEEWETHYMWARKSSLEQPTHDKSLN